MYLDTLLTLNAAIWVAGGVAHITWLSWPMQRPTQAQWWSKRRTQRPQSWQWRLRSSCQAPQYSHHLPGLGPSHHDRVLHDKPYPSARDYNIM